MEDPSHQEARIFHDVRTWDMGSFRDLSVGQAK